MRASSSATAPENDRDGAAAAPPAARHGNGAPAHLFNLSFGRPGADCQKISRKLGLAIIMASILHDSKA
jgi:hypothetical protein